MSLQEADLTLDATQHFTSWKSGSNKKYMNNALGEDPSPNLNTLLILCLRAIRGRLVLCAALHEACPEEMYL